MARNMGATSVNMLAPAVLSTAGLRDALMGEPVLQRQFELIGQAGLIVFGVGGLAAESTMRIADVTSDEEIDAYAREGAAAVLICRFLDRDGKQIVRELDRRVIGIELDELRGVPNRLCVAGGAQKAEAIRAVLMGGYATHLVTDMDAAECLLTD
jgi:DNA-binding transcriptional regulator LsrR (DeoR family)